MSKEANTQLAIRQEKFIRDLKSALVRIENKTYGICRVTGKLIAKKRLLLVPKNGRMKQRHSVSIDKLVYFYWRVRFDFANVFNHLFGVVFLDEFDALVCNFLDLLLVLLVLLSF